MTIPATGATIDFHVRSGASIRVSGHALVIDDPHDPLSPCLHLPLPDAFTAGRLAAMALRVFAEPATERRRHPGGEPAATGAASSPETGV